MRHWTTKADYTSIVYEGTIPREVTLAATWVEIEPTTEQQLQRSASPKFPNVKEAGGVIPASALVEAIQRTAKDNQQEFLPVNNVVALIRQSTQFTLRGWFDSVPADVKQWPDPPHVEFANCSFDSLEDVKRFVEMYGFGAGMIHEPPKKFTLGHLPCTSRFEADYGFDDPRKQAPRKLAITVERLKQDQEFLRRYWGKTAQAKPLTQHFLWSPDDISFANGKPRIVISDIWDYILVLFFIDLSAGRLKVCANPRCSLLKYFAEGRRDQKFCSTKCKNDVHIHLWLANPVNRDRWNADRRKSTRAKASPGRRT